MSWNSPYYNKALLLDELFDNLLKKNHKSFMPRWARKIFCLLIILIFLFNGCLSVYVGVLTARKGEMLFSFSCFLLCAVNFYIVFSKGKILIKSFFINFRKK